MKIDPEKGWYSPQELAGMPGLPGTERRVRSTAQKNLWVSRAKARGKGLEYAVRSLPAETQAAIVSLAHDLVASAPALPVAVDPEKPAKTPPSPRPLSRWERGGR